MIKNKLFMLAVIVFSFSFIPNCKNATNKNNKNKIPSGTNIAFRDDFDTGPYPNSFWQLCWSNNASNANAAWNRFFKNTKYFDCVRVEDGYLKLTAKKEKGPADLDYKTGGVWSLNNRFGIGTSLKVRAKLYKEGQNDKFYVPSAFPAIWYNSLFSNWPEEGEIDLMEWVNKTPEHSYSTIHYNETNTGEIVYAHYSQSNVLNVNEWHTYRCDLYSNNIVMYYDDKEIFRYTNSLTNTYPFNDNYYNIILNASLHGSWGAAVETNDSDLPYEMWVDWVEVSLIDKISGQPIK